MKADDGLGNVAKSLPYKDPPDRDCFLNALHIAAFRLAGPHGAA